MALNNKKKILAEAERQRILKDKKKNSTYKEELENRKRQEQKQYLDTRIIQAEKRKPFKVKI